MKQIDFNNYLYITNKSYNKYMSKKTFTIAMIVLLSIFSYQIYDVYQEVQHRKQEKLFKEESARIMQEYFKNNPLK